MSSTETTDQCAGCQNHLSEYYETICMECARFYRDQFDDGLEYDREV